MSEANKEIHDIFNTPQLLYVIPEKILFDSDLTVEHLRIYSIISSLPCISLDLLKKKLGDFYALLTIDICTRMLIEKAYIEEEEGHFTTSNLYLLMISESSPRRR